MDASFLITHFTFLIYHSFLYSFSMSLPAYFLSDAHLGVNPPGAVPDRERALVRFLESIRGKASHLVVVGDLFEFWYEYNDYVCRNHFDLFFAMRELVKSGCEIHLLQGNHDFAYGDFFPKTVGAQVHKELVLEIQGKRVYFCHGDGVAKSDFGYRLFRRILDFPLGRSSRKVGESRVIKMDEYLHWANKMLKKTDSSHCILGHHHVSGIWNVENGVVASAGDWMKKLTYIQMDAGELNLKEFGI